MQMALGRRLDADLPGEQVVVQLNFEPKGVGRSPWRQQTQMSDVGRFPGHAGDHFYLQIMENQSRGAAFKCYKTIEQIVRALDLGNHPKTL